MDRNNGNTNYLDHSYNDGVSGSLIPKGNFITQSNGRTLRPTGIMQTVDKNEMKNKHILLQHNLLNQNDKSLDFHKYNFENNNQQMRSSINFEQNQPLNGIANLKEKLRKNANVRKWKGREKQFNTKDQNFNSPSNYAQINSRYIQK